MNSIIVIILLGLMGPFRMLMLVGAFAIIGLIPLIFYLITLQNTFNEISGENRRMQPGLVWLNIIPLFGLVWQFVTLINLADSLKFEFEKRGIKGEENRPGYVIGLVYCTFIAISALGTFVGSIIHLQHWPEWHQALYLRILGSAFGIICWIIYWIKINGYKSRLIQNRVELSNLKI